MNEALINNWNSVINDDSLVFHLGDFAWGGYNKWKEIRERLNGHIILIKGNHDEKNLTSTGEKELFDYVSYQMKIRVEGRQVYLNHFPFLCYGGTYRSKDDAVYQLYGHVHSGQFSKGGRDLPRLEYIFPTQYDVGVDNNNYAPVSWHDVDIKIQKQMEESELYNEDEVAKEKENQ